MKIKVILFRDSGVSARDFDDVRTIRSMGDLDLCVLPAVRISFTDGIWVLYKGAFEATAAEGICAYLNEYQAGSHGPLAL